MIKFLRTQTKIINVKEIKEIINTGNKIFILTENREIHIDFIEVGAENIEKEEKIIQMVFCEIIDFLNKDLNYYVLDIYKKQDEISKFFYASSEEQYVYCKKLCSKYKD